MQEDTLKCIGTEPHLKFEYWKPENVIDGLLRDKNSLSLSDPPKQPLIFNVVSQG